MTLWKRLFRGDGPGDGGAEPEASRSERDALREVLHHMPEGVAVTGTDGRARMINPAFRRLFEEARWGRPESPGPEEDPGLLLAALTARTLEEGGSPSEDLSLGESGRRHLSLVASRLPGGNGVVVVARDVTEAVRLAESRKDLVANVSHELKTPLTAIRGYAETLRDGALAEPKTAQRFTRSILAQCERLEALLVDLLTLSKIESQAAPLDSVATVDLGRLVEEVSGVLASQARAREVSISSDLSDPVPRVRGDEAELERMFLNLLENAIKYNRRGGRVGIRVAPSGGDAVVEVQDSGIGIPPEAKERIFERFYRVDKGRARDEGGTGLGLAIVKHAVRRHGGRLEVESTLGKGSTFTIRLPLA